jgi:hypothetical protein
MRTKEEKEQIMQPQKPQQPAKADTKTDDAKKTQEEPFRFTDWASL